MKIKTFNQLEKIKNHILNKEFGLKDFNKTFNKHKDYKKEFIKTFLEDNKEFLKNHLEDNLKYLIFQNPFIFERFKQIENLNKSNINELKTLINGIAFNKNMEFIKNLYNNLNPNQIREITILFYLNNYKEINDLMKSFLIEFYKTEFEDLFNIKNKTEFKNYQILNELK